MRNIVDALCYFIPDADGQTISLLILDKHLLVYSAELSIEASDSAEFRSRECQR